jgi:TrmH family RNA methyltransferase
VRSAAAAGVDCVVFAEGSVDPFGPKTVRASAGAVLRTPVDRGAPLAPTITELRSRDFTIVAADAGAEVALYDVDLVGATAIVLGNEAWGLTPEVDFDSAASIPMEASVESLNVATAGSILLFEAVRQRRLSSAPHG